MWLEVHFVSHRDFDTWLTNVFSLTPASTQELFHLPHGQYNQYPLTLPFNSPLSEPCHHLEFCFFCLLKCNCLSTASLHLPSLYYFSQCWLVISEYAAVYLSHVSYLCDIYWINHTISWISLKLMFTDPFFGPQFINWIYPHFYLLNAALPFRLEPMSAPTECVALSLNI